MCQRSEAETRDILDEMAHDYAYLERGGDGRGTYWRMKPSLHRRLQGRGSAERSQRIDWDVAKTRVLNMLTQRSKRGESGLTNAEVREVTGYTRLQVNRLVQDCGTEGVRSGRIWPRRALRIDGDGRSHSEERGQEKMTRLDGASRSCAATNLGTPS